MYFKGWIVYFVHIDVMSTAIFGIHYHIINGNEKAIIRKKNCNFLFISIFWWGQISHHKEIFNSLFSAHIIGTKWEKSKSTRWRRESVWIAKRMYAKVCRMVYRVTLHWTIVLNILWYGCCNLVSNFIVIGLKLTYSSA